MTRSRACGRAVGGRRRGATGARLDHPLRHPTFYKAVYRPAILRANRLAAARVHGEVVVDTTLLFGGEVAGVRVEPTPTLPGLPAALLLGACIRCGGCQGDRRS